ncbi:MAG: DUF2974 domain-containing protein, partial [Coriobacteriaceae bacterium]|nr:DUF2974 domain-containing protein [Coriobacteriaceae bacterium]
RGWPGTGDEQAMADCLAALRASHRFSPVRITAFTEDYSSERNKQFGAMSVLLPDGNTLVAFRGTDLSFAGWQEDLDMGVKDAIPSQTHALEYLEEVAHAIDDPLIVCGHSKGGNICEYAAVMSDEHTFERITDIYDFDGPAFFKEPSERMHSDSYRSKLHKFVPDSSVVGLLFEDRDDYVVVNSDAPAGKSHTPFSWELSEDGFVPAEQLKKGSVYVGRTFANWMDKVDLDQRQEFVDAVEEVFGGTEAVDWNEFRRHRPTSVVRMLSSGAKLDHEKKASFMAATGKIIVAMKDEGLHLSASVLQWVRTSVFPAALSAGAEASTSLPVVPARVRTAWASRLPSRVRISRFNYRHHS